MSFWNIIFTRNDNGQIVTVQTRSDVMFSEVAFKFCNKAGILGNDKVKFIYNNEELKIESPKSLAELKLRDNAKVEVVMTSTVVGA